MENLEIIAKEMLDKGKYITSIEIAELTGKMHKDAMKTIRNMEPAWESERGRKFALSQLRERIANTHCSLFFIPNQGAQVVKNAILGGAGGGTHFCFFFTSVPEI